MRGVIGTNMVGGVFVVIKRIAVMMMQQGNAALQMQKHERQEQKRSQLADR